MDIPMETDAPAGLYIHIPFCIQKCRYCDFYSITDRQSMPAFINALIGEISIGAQRNRAVDSLYFGGGTPSLLAPEAIERVIDALRRRYTVLPDVQITVEVNPGTITRAHLRAYRKAGVNRINIGVQSFQDDILRFLGRCHTAGEALQAIKWAEEAGFDNIGVDLIYGIPGQSRSSWRADLTKAITLGPAHLSCYLLTFEPGTPLDRSRENGMISPIPDGSARNRFLLTSDTLGKAGYDHYEISNFAKTPATRSRHNRKYWAHVPYIGFGPAAHSFLPPIRRWNGKDVRRYIEQLEKGHPPDFETETLTSPQLMIETIYLGLRQSEGIHTAAFNRRFQNRFESLFKSLLAELVSTGLAVEREDHVSLTRTGMLHADGIAGRFADIVD